MVMKNQIVYHLSKDSYKGFKLLIYSDPIVLTKVEN